MTKFVFFVCSEIGKEPTIDYLQHVNILCVEMCLCVYKTEENHHNETKENHHNAFPKIH